MVGNHDRAHGHRLGRGALTIGEVVLADFFADRFDDALVADHRAEAKREGHGIFDPIGDVVGQGVGMLAQRLLGRADLRFKGETAGFVEFGDGFGNEIKIGAHVAALARRQGLESFSIFEPRADLGRCSGQRGKDFGRWLAARLEKSGELVVGLPAADDGPIGLGGEDGRQLRGFGREAGHSFVVGRHFQGVGAGQDPDQNKDNETHTFLSIVRPVGEAHPRAGKHEDGADPEWWRGLAHRRAVEFGLAHENLQRDEQQGGGHESDNRRNKQTEADFLRLGPIDAVGHRMIRTHQRVGQADAEDGADERVGTGSGQSEIPRPDIPHDGRDEEREDHGEAGGRPDVDD